MRPLFVLMLSSVALVSGDDDSADCELPTLKLKWGFPGDPESFFEHPVTETQARHKGWSKISGCGDDLAR